MSEVYIRSQNKEKLYRLGGNYACVGVWRVRGHKEKERRRRGRQKAPRNLHK